MTSIDTQAPADAAADSLKASLYEQATAALATLSGIMIAVMDWHDRARERRQLLGLSDSALKDFAASRADAVSEGDKPFWRA